MFAGAELERNWIDWPRQLGHSQVPPGRRWSHYHWFVYFVLLAHSFFAVIGVFCRLLLTAQLIRVFIRLEKNSGILTNFVTAKNVLNSSVFELLKTSWGVKLFDGQSPTKIVM